MNEGLSARAQVMQQIKTAEKVGVGNDNRKESSILSTALSPKPSNKPQPNLCHALEITWL